LAEGRERFRTIVTRSEDGSRCAEMRPLISSFCDGEASAKDVDAVREHLRACAGCRATMRAYRATPGAAAALAPVLPARSVLERLHDLVAEAQSRLPLGGGGDSAISQVAAAGGTRGAGMAALAKLLTICAGAAGGAAACVAAGVTPAPLIPAHETKAPQVAHISKAAFEDPAPEAVETAPPEPDPAPEPSPARERVEEAPAPEPAPPPSPVAETSAGAVEYTPPPPPPAPSGGESSAPSSGSVAGEFGP
jgi:hypothetical protein